MTTHELIEQLGLGLEVAGVALLVGGMLFALVRSLRAGKRGANDTQARYVRVRHDIGRAILLGLEVLVAADIVRSVALGPSMGDLAVLATIVAIRTFLSWSLALELDGRWPWQRPVPSPTPHGDTP